MIDQDRITRTRPLNTESDRIDHDSRHLFVELGTWKVNPSSKNYYQLTLALQTDLFNSILDANQIPVVIQSESLIWTTFNENRAKIQFESSREFDSVR